MSNSSVPRGPGLFEVGRASGERMITNVRRIAGGERAPGSVLIGVSGLAAGPGRRRCPVRQLLRSAAVRVRRPAPGRGQHHRGAAARRAADRVHPAGARPCPAPGKSSRTERALILACAIASAYMNVSDADTASPRSVVAYAVAPVALAVVVDRVVAVIRRHVLGVDEASAWTALGRAVVAAVRLCRGCPALLAAVRPGADVDR